MSALGQKRTSEHNGIMSALPPKADIRQCDWHVRFVPKADIEHPSSHPVGGTSTASVRRVWPCSGAVVTLLAGGAVIRGYVGNDQAGRRYVGRRQGAFEDVEIEFVRYGRGAQQEKDLT